VVNFSLSSNDVTRTSVSPVLNLIFTNRTVIVSGNPRALHLFLTAPLAVKVAFLLSVTYCLNSCCAGLNELLEQRPVSEEKVFANKYPQKLFLLKLSTEFN